MLLEFKHGNAFSCSFCLCIHLVWIKMGYISNHPFLFVVPCSVGSDLINYFIHYINKIVYYHGH